MPKKIAVAFGLILFLVITWNIIGQIISTLKSGERLNNAVSELHNLEVKNKELKEKLEEVKNPDFIETQARDKLGLVREGEILVIIPQEKIDSILGLTKKAEEVRLQNWKGWLKLFFP
ncbi:hypothetical protein A3F00_05305 [Candidatus Daviesbacteria bacterium RIFCSPHIGHO2_12_FULL_37_11]|uniref:Septum formation initiator n=1 Tax=Candidatus Daviesbacteria bacterium RIFCSPHIGHO2_12_FULL_37_11 TaxID=1797777 RepID=A0A1F5KAH2_9BACT|nr:MAG: hypothetical protein A2111_01745 [Candidatus Daviesbacteria bacterium GWA1_38_6]OGE17379.1 MAG: hypothetical protein A2769_00865 [Candidatus Daviesbacteria bacterium RIFCSPHIGHO2_01_FULL_37_27]OGE37795.1 MAG: hypothetical protein A3F00_05305 [Candidatus Daviesbacteria bacterium RIFCSPHIGHO2_12_FULL_37_11]